MGVGRHDRIVVQLCQYQLVLRIAQVLDGLLQPFVDLLDFLVVTGMEEHIDWIRPAQQLVMLVITQDVVIDDSQPLCIKAIVWIFDDDLLTVDVSFRSETQYTHGKTLIEVYVEHKYHNEGESGLSKIDGETLKKYSVGMLNDVQILNSVLRDQMGNLKSGGVATFIIGTKNYGSDIDAFIADLKGTEAEIKAVTEYLNEYPCSVIIRTEKASEALSMIWNDYYNVIATFTNEEIADSFGDVSKMNPAQIVNEAYEKYISYDVVSQLPVFKRPGLVTSYADAYAKAAKVGGAEMLRDAITEMIPKDSKTRALSAAFTKAVGTEPITKCTKEENEFADYLLPFVKQLLEATGDKYRDDMNTLLTATGCGEKV